MNASSTLYGSDRSLLNALPDLAQAFSVTLGLPADGPLVERARALGAEVLILPDYALRRRYLRAAQVPPWIVRYMSSVARLHRAHRSRPFDLVYSNTLAAGLGPMLRLLWRVPHLTHVHECPAEPWWLSPGMTRLARMSSAVVICNSRTTREFVVGLEPRLGERAVVVYNGIPIPDVVERSVGAPGTLRVCCVGRVHPKKGQGTLLEAARLAADEGSRWELHFYGDTLPEHEPLRRELLALARDLRLEDRVHWHGFVEDTDAVYRDADVCVVPSVVPEEFSLVCAEAQARSLPVVVTGPGGASEVAVDGETGLVVPPLDAAAMASAVRRLEQDPAEREAMGRAGRARMLSCFSRDRYGKEMRVECERLGAWSSPDHVSW